MKLSEIKKQHPGTYLALKVISPTPQQLIDYCLDNNITLSDDGINEDYHVTVIYSTKHCPNLKTETTKHVAKIAKFDVFHFNEKNILVAILDAPTVVDRHLQIMQDHGASYSHKEYHPHVTLSYEFSGDVNSLPPFHVPFVLGNEYIEDLDDN